MTKDHATGKVGLKRSFQDACPKWLYAGLITAFWVLHPRRPPRIILPHEDHWRVHHLATGALSCIPNRRQVNRGSLEKRNAKLDRYTFPGFADVEKGDTVLDVGAFIGEFTISASVRAERVFSFEPDAVNFACLKHNTIHSSNVTARNLLAWNENERVDFHLGEDVSDHSVFDVDSHQVRESVSIKAVRLDTHLEPKGLSRRFSLGWRTSSSASARLIVARSTMGSQRQTKLFPFFERRSMRSELGSPAVLMSSMAACSFGDARNVEIQRRLRNGSQKTYSRVGRMLSA
jgi:FkbM family methyltransferase